MSQTPYRLLLRKTKQRKDELNNRIQEKNIKNRSIRYNTTKNGVQVQDSEAKSKDNQRQVKQNRTNLTNCLKKSYYYRKLMNKTSYSHFTPQEFQEFKKTFNRASTHRKKDEKSPAIFSKIWENQVQRKYSLGVDEQSHQKFFISQNNTKRLNDLPISLVGIKKNALENKTKVQNIPFLEKGLNLDLQIKGSKKFIKLIGQDSLKKSIKKSNLIKNHQCKASYSQESEICSRTNLQNENKIINIQTKKYNRQLLRMSKGEKKIVDRSMSIKITKISFNKRLFPQNSKLSTSNKWNLKNYAEAKSFGQTFMEKSNYTSCNFSYDPINQRYFQFQQSQRPTIYIKKHFKSKRYTQINDIQAWHIKHQNQEQNFAVFQA